MSKAGQRIIDGLNDARAWVNGDASRAKIVRGCAFPNCPCGPGEPCDEMAAKINAELDKAGKDNPFNRP